MDVLRDILAEHSCLEYMHCCVCLISLLLCLRLDWDILILADHSLQSYNLLKPINTFCQQSLTLDTDCLVLPSLFP